MKKIISILTLVAALTACHDLEVPVENELTQANFPTRTEHFVQAAGPTYTAARGSLCTGYWFLQSLSTDETLLPARGGNWYDGARYMQLHYHTWNADNPVVADGWGWLSSIVTTANQNMAVIETAPESAAKATGLAELRTQRAIALYMLMDLFGNIPLITQFGDTTPPSTVARKDVFAFIEKDVLESIPKLSEDVGTLTYGRPNKFTAYALLAKMYINAEVYIGQKRYDDAVKMCDNIITSKKFALEAAYMPMFGIKNGPANKELIYAVPFDNSATVGTQFFARYYLHRAMRTKYSLPFTPSGAVSIMPEYYALYNDPKDTRLGMFLTGKQYLHNGQPIIIATTKKGFDETYTGADGSTALNYHLELTPDHIVRNVATFDLGNDEKAWAEGYRCMKYYPDSTSTTRNQSNDVSIFRYSDVVLMKAESILRGATATNSETALGLVNSIRTARKATNFTTISLDELLNERAREMVYENWRRNDLIRFGKFEGKWGFKTDTDPNKRIFPIPRSILNLNPKLTQNPGY